MWLKALGLLCAGVFVGAAIVELKQLRRKKEPSSTDSDSPQSEGETADEEPPLDG